MFPIEEIEFSAQYFTDLVNAWGARGMAVIIGLMIVHAFIPFPAEFVAIAAGMCYGPLLGTLLTWLGAMLGGFLSFGLARWLGRPFVQRMLRAKALRTLDQWTDVEGVSTLLVSRLLPVIAFNLINYAAGLTKISWWTFTWTTGLGILPLTALMVIIGDQMIHMEWWMWIIISASVVLLWFAVRFATSRSIRTEKH